jgi:hypothetical protein
MQNTTNKWLTTTILLGFFAIIAVAAGRQAVSTPTNVLVTNALAQPVPVKVTGSTVPLNVNNATHGKDGLTIYRQVSIPLMSGTGVATINAIPGERFVITNIAVNMDSPASEFMYEVLATTTYSGTVQNKAMFHPDTYTIGTDWLSYLNAQTLIYLDPGEILNVTLQCDSANPETASVTVTGYRVSYP